jgi:hypothetical protein
MLAFSPQFAEIWAEYEVEARGPVLKRVDHARAGPLEFECQVLHITKTGQRHNAYCAAAGSPAESAFIQLVARPARLTTRSMHLPTRVRQEPASWVVSHCVRATGVMTLPLLVHGRA